MVCTTSPSPFARLAHDRVGPDTVCGHQHDARPPTMLLRTVPIGDDRRQSPRSALLTGTAIPWRMLVPPRRTASEHTLIGDSYVDFISLSAAVQEHQPRSPLSCGLQSH